MLVCSGTISPSRPSLPARLVPHGLPGVGETGSGAAGPWRDILGPGAEPFSPCQRHSKSVPSVPAPLTFLPCSPGGPRGPCKGGWRRCHLWCDKANAQAVQSRNTPVCPQGLALGMASSCLPYLLSGNSPCPLGPRGGQVTLGNLLCYHPRD